MVISVGFDEKKHVEPRMSLDVDSLVSCFQQLSICLFAVIFCSFSEVFCSYLKMYISLEVTHLSESLELKYIEGIFSHSTIAQNIPSYLFLLVFDTFDY